MSNTEDVNHVCEYVSKLSGIDIDVLGDVLALLPLVTKLENIREKYLEKQDLCSSRFAVLRRLFHHEANTMTPAELADEVSLTRAAMTTTLDGLERIDYVARTPHPTDRRMICVSLTAKGKAYLDRALPDHYRLMAESFGVLTASERAAMIRLYEKLMKKVCEMAELENEDS